MIDLRQGNCLEVLKSLDDESVDSLVTDPPAGISFMGKNWDSNKGGRDAWIDWMTEVMAECKRVLKPGAHGLVWAIPRTSHWTATALENAGFEVRDVVTHLFGSGFPKSHNISKAIDKAAGQSVITAPATEAAKQWDGWGTALKPASEHWILIRKPLSEKTVAKNVLKHGTGGLNIDGCRVETNETLTSSRHIQAKREYPSGYKDINRSEFKQNPQGRFPANLILDEHAAGLLDEQSGVLKTGGDPRKTNQASTGLYGMGKKIPTGPGFSGDTGGASRFFYCAKASKKDKGENNPHPTVKSTKLMEYLVRLITPPGGVVLDCFMGSGSTGVSANSQGFGFIGIEQEQEYIEIAKARLGLYEGKTNEQLAASSEGD